MMTSQVMKINNAHHMLSRSSCALGYRAVGFVNWFDGLLFESNDAVDMDFIHF